MLLHLKKKKKNLYSLDMMLGGEGVNLPRKFLWATQDLDKL